MDHSPKKKAITMSIIFAVVYCIHGSSFPVYSIYQTIQTGSFVSPGFLGWYHILTIVLVAAVYLPLALLINRRSREANMRVLKGISLFVIVALSTFLALNAFAIIAELINPRFLV